MGMLRQRHLLASPGTRREKWNPASPWRLNVHPNGHTVGSVRGCAGGTMKDLNQVLSQKLRDIERVRREIDALLFVIPLLTEEVDRIETRLSSRATLEWTGQNSTSR